MPFAVVGELTVLDCGSTFAVGAGGRGTGACSSMGESGGGGISVPSVRE